MKVTRYPGANSNGSGLLYGAYSDTTSQTIAAQTTPFAHPAVPSVIMTVFQVS